MNCARLVIVGCSVLLLVSSACRGDSSGASGNQAASADVVAKTDAPHADHSAAAAPADDRGWATLQGLSAQLQHVAPSETPVARLAPGVRAEFFRQLNLTVEVLKKYPTVRHAEAAGFSRHGPYFPGLGAHWVLPGRENAVGPLTDDQILNPSAMLYDGLSQDSAAAGIMYVSKAANPEGFAGPNDHWHAHSGICSQPSKNGGSEVISFDGLLTQGQCESLGFSYSDTPTPMMLHVWTVPGYTNPLGVFHHVNPAVTCKDGTYHVSMDMKKTTYVSDRCKAR